MPVNVVERQQVQGSAKVSNRRHGHGHKQKKVCVVDWSCVDMIYWHGSGCSNAGHICLQRINTTLNMHCSDLELQLLLVSDTDAACACRMWTMQEHAILPVCFKACPAHIGACRRCLTVQQAAPHLRSR
jgi:hypothetical protein